MFKPSARKRKIHIYHKVLIPMNSPNPKHSYPVPHREGGEGRAFPFP
jgi:hypothetical protein